MKGRVPFVNFQLLICVLAVIYALQLCEISQCVISAFDSRFSGPIAEKKKNDVISKTQRARNIWLCFHPLALSACICAFRLTILAH